MNQASPITRIIGIDPGSVITGYGVIESDGQRSFHIAHGHVRVRGTDFAEKLGHIHAALGDILDRFKPAEAAVEAVFISRNAMSALKLGQARGAALTAIVTRSVSVAEYSARSVKQVVTGSGSADKQQVQVMVRAMLHLERPVQIDAADGLAIALCHAHSRTPTVPKPVVVRRRRGGRGLRW